MTCFFDKLTAFVFSLIFLLFCFWCILTEPPETVVEERRASYDLPELSVKSLADGSALDGCERYLLDALLFRSLFYRLHTAVSSDVFGNSVCHGIKETDGGLEKVLPRYDETLVSANLEVLAEYRAMLSEQSSAYSVLLPDKSVYTGSDVAYQKALSSLRGLSAFELVTCRDTLSIDSYFYGDIHIRPECYGELAERLSDKIGFHSEITLDTAEGIIGKGTLSLQYPREITEHFSRLTDQAGVLDRITVTTPDGESRLLYDVAAATEDPYNYYLGGEASNGILTVKNPNADAQKLLIVFRDSFMRAFLPYLAAEYGEIVLIDLRAPRHRIVSVLEAYGELDCDILLFVSTHTLFSTRF